MSDDDHPSPRLGGTLGGLHRREVPDRAAALLARWPQTVELRIRPEQPACDENHHYAIDWERLDPDPAAALMDSDTGSGAE